MARFNLYSDGIQRGWSVRDAARLERNEVMETDVVVIGTGAGGGTTAERLSKAGLRVIMVEEGRLYSDPDFKLSEKDSYTRLYQEGMSRATADGGIAILQGRCVGGSTTVNWTSSFRTPEETLAYWHSEHGVLDSTREDLNPWFEQQEKRLNISRWQVEPNKNNSLLRDGCAALDWHWDLIPRNVEGCWDLGYCGLGCPNNAKQSTLVTSVPGALSHGATLIHGLRADRLLHAQGEVLQLAASALDRDGVHPTGRKVYIKARHFVVAASAIGTPGLLLRSKAPDPHGQLGRHTWLHPVNATVAHFDETVAPYKGAPQSVYSDEFLWRDGVTGAPGFKLEVPPLHPLMAAAVLPDHGTKMAEQAAKLPHTQSVIALLRDGFHRESPGGTVTLRDDGSPKLDYPMTDYLWEGLRDAYKYMVELQFAAGAKAVRAVHMDAGYWHSVEEAHKAIRELPMATHRARLFTAHQMGGCRMGEDPTRSVADSYGRHHQLDNLSIHDASLFPTSLGVNPQLTVYALAARNSERLAKQLIG